MRIVRYQVVPSIKVVSTSIQSSPPTTERYQPREKEEEGEEKEDSRDMTLLSFDDPDLSLPSLVACRMPQMRCRLLLV
ncbi:hypothetical protein GW17_00026093 [Ensete ventricosum]|nr:hypothetical protein GW17_00026093 [Ensete ventricosum]